MVLKTAYLNRGLKTSWIINYSLVWRLIIITCLITLFFVPQSGHTKEKKNHSDRLPPAPNTGSPEEDFAAGGTRDNRLRNTACGEDTENIVYLLGNRNREFTASAYPSFWFYIPQNLNGINKIKLIVTELATGKKIYDRVLPKPQKSGIIGVNIPQSPKYALAPKTNYTWSLQVDCTGTQQEVEIALTGWLSRLPSNSKLQNQLAQTAELEKYKVYLQHNLLYDALTDLASLRIAKPNNPNIEVAWTDLLSKLGWQDIIQPKSAVYRSDVDMEIANM